MSIAKMSLIGGIMILAVVIFRAFGINKQPKRVFILLWEIVLLRLLLPVSISLPILPAVESSLPVQTYIHDSGTMQYNNALPNNAPSVQGVPDNVNAAANAVPALPDVNAEAKQPMSNTAPAKRGISLKTVYLAGVAATAAFFVLSYAYSMGKFGSSRKAENEYISQWLKSHKSARRISVKYSDKTVSPLTYGVFRPVILLPSDTDFSDQTRLDCILEHEYAHIRHFDSLKKLIAAAALCLHWFNPLVWLMNMLYNRDIELWCDECVIKKFGEESRSTYARVLITMEELKIGVLPISAFCRSSVKERIISIMKFKKTTLFAMIAAALLTAGVTATIIATSVKPVPKEAGKPSEQPTVGSESKNGSDNESAVKREMTAAGKIVAYNFSPNWNHKLFKGHNSKTANGTISPVIPEDADSKKKIYDSFYSIRYCRQDGEDIPVETIEDGWLEKGERAAIVFEFDYELTEAEKAIDVFADASVMYDDGFSHLADESLQNLRLTSKIISGNTVTFLFEAPESASYLFSYSNYAPKWLYALDYYIELESAVTPGKFGSQVIENFNGEYVVYSKEEFNEYLESKYLEFRHTQTVTDLTFFDRLFAIEDDIDYIQIGEPLNGWWEIKGEDERFAGKYGYGTYGLSYTLDSCTVYDSWRDSGVPEEDMRFCPIVNKNTKLKFIVLDMTATYNKPASDYPDEVQPYFGWDIVMRSFEQEKIPYYYFKEYSYFSACPKEGDININIGKPLNRKTNYLVFGKPIKDGQSVHFKYGFFAQESVIEEKNLYLRDRTYRYCAEEDKLQYVNILGNK